jgi:hypothetical protein
MEYWSFGVMDEPRAAGHGSSFSAGGNRIHSLGKKDCAIVKSGWREQIILMVNRCPAILLQYSNTTVLQCLRAMASCGLTKGEPSGPDSLILNRAGF